MKITFTVNDLPPKKDGANSMWRKGLEVTRLKSLRVAASEAMAGKPPLGGPLHMKLTLYGRPADGDLDNFITGLCDGLMAAHRATPIDDAVWKSVPAAAHPLKHIVFTDDAMISAIYAERLPPDRSGFHYTVEISTVGAQFA